VTGTISRALAPARRSDTPEDGGALRALFDAHYVGMCRFACAYVGAPEVAEELVQEVFLYLLQRPSDMVERASTKAYLYTAVRNIALNHVRHERVVAKGEADAIALFDRDVVSADETLDAADLARVVRRVVDRLPPQCRLVFTLSRQQGLSYGEIAQVLEIAPKTVENQMSKALKALRRALGHPPR
jgi:RNA polymerase sigma-70 factor (ECF subfamily)